MENLGKNKLNNKNNKHRLILYRKKEIVFLATLETSVNCTINTLHPVTYLMHILGQVNFSARETLSKGDHLALVCIPTL